MCEYKKICTANKQLIPIFICKKSSWTYNRGWYKFESVKDQKIWKCNKKWKNINIIKCIYYYLGTFKRKENILSFQYYVYRTIK